MEEVFVTVDFTDEVIEDINKSLKNLQDSCQHDCNMYTCSSIKDQKLRSKIYSNIPKWLDVAYHVHNTFKSSLPSTSTTIGSSTTTTTTTIGNGMKTWETTLVDLITDFTNLRTTIMNDYMLKISNRIYQAMGEKVNVSTIMTLFKEYDNSSSNGDNYMDDFETMILKKLMKERHESMKLISDGMEKLDKVLFETYVMVQKQVILLTGGGEADEKVCDESSETLVYKENEARDKRFRLNQSKQIETEIKTLLSIICVVIAMWILHHFGLIK